MVIKIGKLYLRYMNIDSLNFEFTPNENDGKRYTDEESKYYIEILHTMFQTVIYAYDPDRRGSEKNVN